MKKNLIAFSVISLISFLAVGFLFWLIYFFELSTVQGDFSFLPTLNACFNALSATCVCFGLLQIKKGNTKKHRVLMISAFVASSIFLIGYIAHHTLNGDTKFLTEGFLRPIYFLLLISHVLLSIIALPLVLNTIYFALTGQYTLHKKLARYTYPIWLYVSVTGVIIYFFLRFLNHA